MAKAKTTTTADEQVQQLIALVKGKKDEIAKAEKPDWKTNCSFAVDPTTRPNDRTNIQTVADIDALVGILAFLKGKERDFKEASDLLGVSSKFKWMGYTVAEWQSDLQNRINKVQINKKKADLQALEMRLDRLISPELRREMELAEITKMLAAGE
jgi:hypothetical protein